MRTLFVSSFYPPHDIGGYEKHCQEVTDALRDRGHDVRVLTSRHGVAAHARAGHITRTLFLEADLEHYSPPRFFLRRDYEEKHNTAAVQSAIADIAPDAILFWGMWNLSRWVPAVAEHSGVPVAYWLGDLWPLEPDVHTRYWLTEATGTVGRLLMPYLSRVALRRLKREGYPPSLEFRNVACGSQFLKQKLAAEIPAFEDASVVLCGIGLEPFVDHQPHTSLFDKEAPRIVYVGGLGPHKGVHTAVEAVSHIKRRRPDLKPLLTVVGSGHPDHERRLRRLAETVGIGRDIHFEGQVEKHQVPAILAEHDILVMPTACEEGFGRVVVEGMAAGLAVVGTATGGSAEILTDEANGLVFPVADGGALAACLLRLVDDRALYRRLAYAAKESSKQFDLQHMIDGVERFLVDVVSSTSQAVAADG